MKINDNVFLRNCVFFRDYLAPTQWAVGDCPPLKELPERGPAAGALKKLISFLISKSTQNEG